MSRRDCWGRAVFWVWPEGLRAASCLVCADVGVAERVLGVRWCVCVCVCV